MSSASTDSRSPLDDKWASGDAYEAYMGRWSRLLAEQAVRWLDPERGLAWLDVGCGTGALASAILKLADPSSVVACDPSESFVEYAKSRLAGSKISVVVAGSDRLPERPGGFDRIVSGLVLNFVGDPRQFVRDMRERVRPGGIVAAYVWDYAERMEYLRLFWDAAVATDPKAKGELDEAVRFPMCRPEALESIFRDAEMKDVESDAIEIPIHFPTFEDYWRPFLGGTGPVPSYVASLSAEGRAVLRADLESRVPVGPGGEVALVARAWVVRGRSD